MKRHKSKRQNDVINRPETLCWRCAKSVNMGCSWSKSFLPVDGWTAEENHIRRNGIGGKDYRVIECPEFERG